MTTNGRAYLNKHKNHLGLPLISRVSAIQSASLALDIKASRIFAMANDIPHKKHLMSKDFTQPPILVP